MTKHMNDDELAKISGGGIVDLKENPAAGGDENDLNGWRDKRGSIPVPPAPPGGAGGGIDPDHDAGGGTVGEFGQG